MRPDLVKQLIKCPDGATFVHQNKEIVSKFLENIADSRSQVTLEGDDAGFQRLLKTDDIRSIARFFQTLNIYSLY